MKIQTSVLAGVFSLMASIGFAEDVCVSAGSLMPKAAVDEFAQFAGFED